MVYNSLSTVSGVEDEGAGDASAPPKIVIIWKFGQNLLIFGQNFWKSEQDPQISRKYLWKFGQQWGPTLFYFKKLSPNVCRKTSEDHFLKGRTKNGRQKLHKNFLGKFRKIWAKILCTPKNVIAPTPMSTASLFWFLVETQQKCFLLFNFIQNIKNKVVKTNMIINMFSGRILSVFMKLRTFHNVYSLSR